jgi:hypothetical protein
MVVAPRTLSRASLVLDPRAVVAVVDPVGVELEPDPRGSASFGGTLSIRSSTGY